MSNGQVSETNRAGNNRAKDENGDDYVSFSFLLLNFNETKFQLGNLATWQ